MSTVTNASDTDTPEVEQSPLEATIDVTLQEMMKRPELLQMRMENDSIMAECRLRPRDLKAIKQELQDQLEAFPALAEDAIYCKPVGDNKFAEGLSIRAAEVLAEVYGYNRVESDVSPIDDDTVRVSASFVDYQNGRIWRDSGMLSKWFMGANKARRRHSDDRFYSLVAKADAARRVREVILRSVNTGLKAWFTNECRKVMELSLDDESVAKIVTSFAGIGVGLEQLEKLVGRPKAMGWLPRDRTALLGVWNAIKDGESTVEAAFGKAGGVPDNDHAKQAAEAGKKKKAKKKPAEPAFDRDTRMAAFRSTIKAATGKPDIMADVMGNIDADPDLSDLDRQTLHHEAEAAAK